jgi:lipopolysaccharide export system permease protein
MKIPGLTIIDRYIIRKFLGTFFFIFILIVAICIVFDITEKLENFIDGHVSLYTIVFVYYINFIPYIGLLLTPLILFIAVIFFTSRMAANSEIVAILSTGITFNRMLRPYFISAAIITALNIYANNWLVPNSNKTRIAFEDRYVNSSWYSAETNIHMQVDKGVFVYMQSYNYSDSSGYKFAAEKFIDGNLVYKLKTDRITWDAKSKKWKMKNFSVRRNGKMSESLYYGKDTAIAYNFSPKDFGRKVGEIVTLNARELDEVIAEEKMKGADDVPFYEIEKYKRTAFPFAIFILTLIAVSLASRKVRGGIGLHIGLGIALSFSYILFQQLSTTFSTNGNLPSWIGVWIPNLIFAIIAFALYRRAPK